jgi:hypothetical protein
MLSFPLPDEGVDTSISPTFFRLDGLQLVLDRLRGPLIQTFPAASARMAALACNSGLIRGIIFSEY